MYWLFIYASKYIFSEITIEKPSQNWLNASKMVFFLQSVI